MTRIYCECGTELTVLETISDDLYSLKHIVERCPNCASGWISVKDNPPGYDEHVLTCWDNRDDVIVLHRYKHLDDEIIWADYINRRYMNPPDWWKPMSKAKGFE